MSGHDNPYTPSLALAADLYVRASVQPAHDAGRLPAKYPDEYRAEFDRMIATVKAEAWGEGFTQGMAADHRSEWWPRNPYIEEESA